MVVKQGQYASKSLGADSGDGEVVGPIKTSEMIPGSLTLI